MASGPLVNPAQGPLKGIKVLDFGTFVAGTYNAVLMGDMGANVIKIESLEGEAARSLGPYLANESRIFQGWNRNKRSLSIDMKSAEGIEVIYDLVRHADVVTENFRPGIANKLKLDYETLSAINGKIVYCTTTGFGPTGPLSRRAAFDGVLQAMGGVAEINARFAGHATLSAILVADFQGAMLSLTSILAALFHRERTGEGQQIETSLLQAVMSLQPTSYYEALETKEEGEAGGYPYRLFDTSDGVIFVSAITPKLWALLCAALGVPEMSEDPGLQTNSQRRGRLEELDGILEPIFGAKTTDQWEEILTEGGVPCAGVWSAKRMFDHPQVEAIGMNQIIHHSTVGPIRVLGVPFKFHKSPGAVQRAAPRLGEHNEQILDELGYDTGKIETLMNSGILKRIPNAAPRAAKSGSPS